MVDRHPEPKMGKKRNIIQDIHLMSVSQFGNHSKGNKIKSI